MKRVLVTGVGGFIGRHVVEPLLARGYAVHGVTGGTRSALGSATLHSADLLLHGSVDKLIADVKPTHLLHLAWVSNPGRAMMSLDNVRWIASSLDLFRSFVEHGGQRAVMIGSCAEYDWSYPELREDETPLRPRSIYGVAKNAVREVVEAVGQHHNVSTVWARLFFLYGPHEPPGRLVSEIASGLAAGRVTTTTAGRQERDFLHVADAAEALARILDGPVTGTLNVASGQCIPVRGVIDALGRLSGRPDLLDIGGRPSAPDDPPRLAANIGRLREEVGFVPRYRLEEGLADTLQWWRDEARSRPQH
jgi:nucleoside-diphosphate-sugar epimerase